MSRIIREISGFFPQSFSVYFFFVCDVFKIFHMSLFMYSCMQYYIMRPDGKMLHVAPPPWWHSVPMSQDPSKLPGSMESSVGSSVTPTYIVASGYPVPNTMHMQMRASPRGTSQPHSMQQQFFFTSQSSRPQPPQSQLLVEHQQQLREHCQQYSTHKPQDPQQERPQPVHKPQAPQESKMQPVSKLPTPSVSTPREKGENSNTNAGKKHAMKPTPSPTLDPSSPRGRGVAGNIKRRLSVTPAMKLNSTSMTSGSESLAYITSTNDSTQGHIPVSIGSAGCVSTNNHNNTTTLDNTYSTAEILADMKLNNSNGNEAKSPPRKVTEPRLSGTAPAVSSYVLVGLNHIY